MSNTNSVLKHVTRAVLSLLLAVGLNTNANAIDYRIALIDASGNGRTETVKQLLRKGANINAADQFGETALTAPVCNSNTDRRLILRALLGEDQFEDEELTDELVDSKNTYLPAFIASCLQFSPMNSR